MGLCASASLEDQLSRQIDRDLKKLNQQGSEVTKLLLLGAGGSGKSTIMRQFKMLYTSGFNQAERVRFRYEIRKNLVFGLQVLIQATRDFQKETASILESNFSHIDQVCSWKESQNIDRSNSSLGSSRALLLDSKPQTATKIKISEQPWSPEMTTACEQLFNDPAILSAVEISSKLQLEDSVRYFRQHIQRVGDENYVPTDLDIAHVRIRTTGVHFLEFFLNEAKFLCVDVGGQRNERRKWISQFDNADAVLFVASLAAFDMTLIEERTKNRASEAIELFEEISHSPYFRQTVSCSSSFLLFFFSSSRSHSCSPSLSLSGHYTVSQQKRFATGKVRKGCSIF